MVVKVYWWHLPVISTCYLQRITGATAARANFHEAFQLALLDVFKWWRQRTIGSEGDLHDTSMIRNRMQWLQRSMHTAKLKVFCPYYISILLPIPMLSSITALKTSSVLVAGFVKISVPGSVSVVRSALTAITPWLATTFSKHYYMYMF